MERKLTNIKVLESADAFEQREKGLQHTAYTEEAAFYTLIQQGNPEGVKTALARLLSGELVVGKLSKDSVRQAKYWAVCCITLGTRYAIQGGLPEMLAFNLSDEYIMHVDGLSTEAEVAEYICNAVVALTELVRDNSRANLPSTIKICLDYIDLHLHEKILVSQLAELVGYDVNYFTKLFKKHLGVCPVEYITSKKLEEAKHLLLGEYDQNMIGYYLGFCSQTYFITRFKKQFGITPMKYAKSKR